MLLVDQGLVLNKQEFRDFLRIISPCPTYQASVFVVRSIPSAIQGGFVTQRHDGLRNLLTSLIGKVCTTVEVEPQLQPLDNERFNLRSAVTSPEARLDFNAGGFWSRGVTAFFDVKITHVNSKCNQGKTTSTKRRRTRGTTNRGYRTLKWDLSLT